jgi:hypothetical protein
MRNYNTTNFIDINGKGGEAFAPDVKKVKIGNVPVSNPVLPESYDSVQGQDMDIRAGLNTISKKNM